MKIYNKIVCADIDVKYKEFRCSFGGADKERKAERRKRKVYFEFNNGKLTQHWGREPSNQKEIAYIHLQKKMKNTVGEDVKHFYIYPNTILDRNKHILGNAGIVPGI